MIRMMLSGIKSWELGSGITLAWGSRGFRLVFFFWRIFKSAEKLQPTFEAMIMSKRGQ